MVCHGYGTHDEVLLAGAVVLMNVTLLMLTFAATQICVMLFEANTECISYPFLTATDCCAAAWNAAVKSSTSTAANRQALPPNDCGMLYYFVPRSYQVQIETFKLDFSSREAQHAKYNMVQRLWTSDAITRGTSMICTADTKLHVSSRPECASCVRCVSACDMANGLQVAPYLSQLAIRTTASCNLPAKACSKQQHSAPAGKQSKCKQRHPTPYANAVHASKLKPCASASHRQRLPLCLRWAPRSSCNAAAQ